MSAALASHDPINCGSEGADQEGPICLAGAPAVLIVVALEVVLTSQAHAVCESALVMAVYQSSSDVRSDWRLNELVDNESWQNASHNAGANATLFGVPIGASYSDYKSAASRMFHSQNERLSTSQLVNVAATALDPNSPSVYKTCLENQVFMPDGLHAAIVGATASDISILVKWFVPGGATSANVTWNHSRDFWHRESDKPGFEYNDGNTSSTADYVVRQLSGLYDRTHRP